MIIDCHSHLGYAPLYPDRYLTNMFSRLNDIERLRMKNLMSLFLKDHDGSVFIKQMDAAGIDKAVLLIIDGGVAFGEAELSIEEIYEVHYIALKNYPDRFIVFAGMDPRRGKAGYELFKKGIETYNFKGLKLYPPMGFSMDYWELLPYYEYCQKHRLPVLLHTGPSQESLRNDLANPLFIGAIAKKYPETNFILAHAGYSLNDDLIKLITSTNNIFIDIAGFQSSYEVLNEHMISDFDLLFTGELNKKTLFGNDWPLFNLITPLLKNIETISQLSTYYNHKFEGALENIMYNNARYVLNIA